MQSVQTYQTYDPNISICTNNCLACSNVTFDNFVLATRLLLLPGTVKTGSQWPKCRDWACVFVRVIFAVFFSSYFCCCVRCMWYSASLSILLKLLSHCDLIHNRVEYAREHHKAHICHAPGERKTGTECRGCWDCVTKQTNENTHSRSLSHNKLTIYVQK